MLDLFAEVLNAVESGGRWPRSFLQAAQPILAKASGTEALNPAKQRCLTLNSVFYSAWVAVRYNSDAFNQWRQDWVEPEMRGARPGATTQGVTYRFSLLAEAGGPRPSEPLLLRVG